MSDNDNIIIMTSSAIASVVATLITNPLEILKIRSQMQNSNFRKPKLIHQGYGMNSMVGGSTSWARASPLNNIQYINQSSARIRTSIPYTEPQIWSSLKIIWLKQEQIRNQQKRKNKLYKDICICKDNKSLLATMRQIYTKEGIKTFFNGWKYAALQSAASSMCFFLCYEKVTSWLKNKDISNQRIGIPIIAGLISRIVTTTITYPLDYFRVLQSSYKGYTQKKNLDLGNKVSSGYIVTMQRDIIFSCLFWSILENSKLEMKKFLQFQDDVINFSCGLIAGMTTSLITLPLDVVKTRQQVNTRIDLNNLQDQDNYRLSTIKSLQQIIQDEGLQGIFKGYKPRIMKVTLQSGLVIMIYENLKLQLFSSNQL